MSHANITRIDSRRAGTGSVAIDEVDLDRSRTFRVYATALLIIDGERTQTHDYYDADSLQLARAVQQVAARVLRGGRRPDLRAIAADLKRRDRSLAGRRRGMHGAVLLGDTPPDELPG